MLDKHTGEIKGFLYFIEDNVLLCKSGYCKRSKNGIETTFLTETGFAYMCNDEPGRISSRTLWLVDRNDELARKLFIDYEENRISELTYLLNAHRRIIKILKGEKL